MVCGCPNAPADPPAADDDGGTSAGASTTGDTGSGTTFSDPLSCSQSRECAETSSPFCVAPYDPGSGTIEEAACVAECVAVGDLARACRDDDSCCAGLLCNQVDGFCAAEAVDSTSSSSGGDTDTDTDTTSGTGGSSSSSSSTSTSSTGGDTGS